MVTPGRSSLILKSEAQDRWFHQPGQKPYSTGVQQRHRLRATSSDCDRPLTCPQRPRATSLPRVRIEGVTSSHGPVSCTRTERTVHTILSWWCPCRWCCCWGGDLEPDLDDSRACRSARSLSAVTQMPGSGKVTSGMEAWDGQDSAWMFPPKLWVVPEYRTVDGLALAAGSSVAVSVRVHHLAVRHRLVHR
jgi:hypothetical protein